MEKPESSIIFNANTWIMVSVLFVLMMAAVYAGVRFHKSRTARGKLRAEGGAIMSAVLALFGFLLAFTFGMSGTRYDARRHNIVNEANAIGTATLRADLYPDSARVALRRDFQRYVEARIAYFEEQREFDKVRQTLEDAQSAGNAIWSRVAELSHNPDLFVASNQMVPAVNQMLDAMTTRTVGELSRVPDPIVYMLFIMAVTSAFVVGYSLAGTIDWMSASAFCFLTAFVIFVIFDLDRPRRGFIDLSISHQAIVELREMF